MLESFPGAGVRPAPPGAGAVGRSSGIRARVDPWPRTLRPSRSQPSRQAVGGDGRSRTSRGPFIGAPRRPRLRSSHAVHALKAGSPSMEPTGRTDTATCKGRPVSLMAVAQRDAPSVTLNGGDEGWPARRRGRGRPPAGRGAGAGGRGNCAPDRRRWAAGKPASPMLFRFSASPSHTGPKPKRTAPR